MNALEKAFTKEQAVELRKLAIQRGYDLGYAGHNFAPDYDLLHCALSNKPREEKSR